MSDNRKNNSQFGMLGIIQVIFLVLKLTDNLDWSWWVVLTPVWVWLGIYVLLSVVLMTCTIINKRLDRSDRRKALRSMTYGPAFRRGRSAECRPVDPPSRRRS